MGKINISFMAEDTFYSLKKDIGQYLPYFMKNKTDSQWINDITSNPTYITKRYEIEDFTLKIPEGNNDRLTEAENSKIIYEALKDLPPYVLANKYFWAWIMFEKCYRVALIMMKDKKETTFNNQWLGASTDRRGLFFGLISRMYFRVALTIDETLLDRYELTDYVLENPSRFRELSWRNIVSCRHIVRGFIKGIKKVNDVYNNVEKGVIYARLAKELSTLGSIKVLDFISESEIIEFTEKTYIGLLKEKRLI